MASTQRTVGLAMCIGLVAIYSWFAARSFQAAQLASSLDVASVERAVVLEPRDAAYQDLLCRFLFFDKQEAGAAVPRCERATELNPHSSTYWLDLALAYYSIGEEYKQQQAILKAVSVDPTTPDVAWNAANFFLAQGKVPEALQQFSVVMRGDRSMVKQSLDLCWRRVHDASAIEAILPPDANAYLQFVRLLTANNEWETAHHAWSALLLLNQDLDYHQALFYVDSLLQNHDVAHANEAWEQLASRSVTLNHYRRTDDLVVDGGFEAPILNAGFDWRYAAHPGSAASLDMSEFHSGRQSLLISYKGAGGDAGVSQYVPVKPNTQYTVSAWARSEKLEGANGACISVSDAYDGKLYALTQETLGTTAWHRLESFFQTGPETELVTIRFSRDPGNTLIEGKLWIDDVKLRPTVESPHTQQ